MPAQAAEPPTAEQALENYRKTFPTIGAEDCGPATGDEVVICGRRTRPSARLPLPVDGDRGVRLAGDPPATGEILLRDRCSADRAPLNCDGSLPVAPIIGLLIEGVTSLVEGGD